jgi:DNA polymerase-3 subunit alpha
MERIEARTLNRRVVETLAKAGAFDSLEPNRARVIAGAEQLIAHANAAAEDRASAQVSLFGDSEPPPRAPLPQVAPWPVQDRLDNEYAALGLFLSGHPLDDMAETLRRKNVIFLSEIAGRMQGAEGAFRMAGIVRAKKERPTKRGDRIAWVTLSDPTGEYEVMVMPEDLAAARERLVSGTPILFQARVRITEGEMKLSAQRIELLENIDTSGCKGIKVYLGPGAPADELARVSETLRGLQASSFGELRIVLTLPDGREVELQPPGRFPIDVAARRALKSARGVEAVSEY